MGHEMKLKYLKIQEFHYGLVTAKNMLCIAVSSPTRVKTAAKTSRILNGLIKAAKIR